jgi:flagellar basal body-associated protein FliL
MPEQQDAAENITQKEENSRKKGFAKFGRMGKIFLLAGIVLIQAAAAYAIVSSYYPQMNNLASSLQTSTPSYYIFKNLIINPESSNGNRYLLFSLTVKLNSEDALNTLEKNKAMAKDRVNLLMSSYTVPELRTIENRNKIKKKLGVIINKIIGKKSVRNLFFTKYVLQ